MKAPTLALKSATPVSGGAWLPEAPELRLQFAGCGVQDLRLSAVLRIFVLRI